METTERLRYFKICEMKAKIFSLICSKTEEKSKLNGVTEAPRNQIEFEIYYV